MPQNCEEEAPFYKGEIIEPSLPLEKIIPANPNQPYDIREVISGIVDSDTFFEVQADQVLLQHE